MKDRIFLTNDEAIELLGNAEQTHTFRSGNSILLGADWDTEELKNTIKSLPEGRVEIGGEQCMKMGHGLVVWTSENDPLFVEVNTAALLELEKAKS